MDNLIIFGDIVEKNGRTIRENNLTRKHKYSIGDLIELDDGERLFVLKNNGRDCDGSPLYKVGLRCDEKPLLCCYGEESMKLINKGKLLNDPQNKT